MMWYPDLDTDVGSTQTPSQHQVDSRGKRKRTRTGCITCRARKVKCDEEEDGCSNCARLSMVCPGYGTNVTRHNRPSGLPDVTEAGIKRRRVLQSCEQCRASKTRCSGDRPCSRCSRKNILCSFPDKPVPGAESSHHSGHSDHDHGDDNLQAYTIATPDSQTPFAHSSAHTTDGLMPHPFNSLAWLHASQLPPSDPQIRALVEEYFANIHPLRCFGFIHKPSFYRRLDEGLALRERENALLYIVCAIGARFYALKHSNTTLPFREQTVVMAGNQWAERAQVKILTGLANISVENLMAAVLLQDHEVRIGNFASAFMLTGVTTRMAQALQINLEYSEDILCYSTKTSPSVIDKESRRRLMWCCWAVDVSVGSGVDQLTLLHEEDMKIQLPCDERHFLLEEPCITETLHAGEVLKFARTEVSSSNPADNMGMAAYYIRLVHIRKQVVRYVKHLDAAIVPWLDRSEFAILDRSLTRWHETLPENLRFNAGSTSVSAETGEFGALCLLHGAFHLTSLDLYRIFVPILYKVRSAFTFPEEQNDFLANRQRRVFSHAQALANIIKKAMSEYGAQAFADFWWPNLAFDSSRNLVYYVCHVLGTTEGLEDMKAVVKGHLQNNISALELMKPINALAEPLALAAERILVRFTSGSAQDSIDDNEIESPSLPGTPLQSAPDYVLHPLSIYRMARKTILEKHAPEKLTSPAATANSPTTSISTNLEYLVTHRSQPEVSKPESNGHRQSVIQPTIPMDDLQFLMPSDFTSFWQPADTIAEGVYGMPQWAAEYRPAEPMSNFWPPNG